VYCVGKLSSLRKGSCALEVYIRVSRLLYTCVCVCVCSFLGADVCVCMYGEYAYICANMRAYV
jgi:hypothetical protein